MTSVGDPVRVSAWIVWEDGVEELIVGHAVAWTARAPCRFGSGCRLISTRHGCGRARCVEHDSRAAWTLPSLAAIDRARVVIEELAAAPEPAYGISTGFGALATRHIPVD